MLNDLPSGQTQHAQDSDRELLDIDEQAKQIEVLREAAKNAEPVAWRCDWDRWRQYHDGLNPLPSDWDDDPPIITPLYAAPIRQLKGKP
jgi:hypothetical protein